jgi:hypothetical protein
MVKFPTAQEALLSAVDQETVLVENLKNLIMTQGVKNPSVVHPMEKLQRQVRSLVNSKVLKPTDSLWKIAFLYGDDWGYWKQELKAYDFTMQDPVSELLVVESWEDTEEG